LAATNLLALIDDIANLLDDISVLSKAAAKKTAGVLGDDLALNAQQVAGVKADRELPVVWEVTKGSIKNKIILVPSALLISAIVPWAISILLIIGGAFLCFEGVEKLFHKFLHSAEDDIHKRQEKLRAVCDPSVDMVAFEKQKIKGAIRTDFILSAEIIIIILGSIQDSNFATQVVVLSGLAIAFTFVVYGIVAGIVKLDDAGLYLSEVSISGLWGKFKRSLGKILLLSAPYLMKILSIVGTAAMFLVGGGLLVHNISFIHHIILSVTDPLQTLTGFVSIFTIIAPLLLEVLVGIILGVIVLLGIKLIQRVVPSVS
jgi:predicted DNA repair protein MutK